MFAFSLQHPKSSTPPPPAVGQCSALCGKMSKLMISNDFHNAWLHFLFKGYVICSLICSFLSVVIRAAEDRTDLWRSPGPCSQHRWGIFNCRVQSRELEGRSCHVSLFAREPSSLQRSTTLSPCTLFSPYSGPTRSTSVSHLHLMSTTPPPLLLLLLMMMTITLLPHLSTTKHSHHLAALSSLPPLTFFQLLNFTSDGTPPQTRTTLTS